MKPYRTIIVALVVALSALGCPEEDPPPAEEGWTEAFDSSNDWLLSIAGSSPEDLYAVGGMPAQGRIVHGDGEGWREIEVDAPLLNWVHVFDDGDAFIVGNGGTILRGDASGFEPMESPTDEDLWGVWGSSPDDVWAVGGRGNADAARTILRFDGDQWRSIELELERPGVNAYFKVWGSDADNVWIVGQNGVVVRWNGVDFEESGVGTSRDLISVWGTGSDDVYTVGGRGNGIIARWDGESWTSQDLAPAPGLNGVWAGESGVWVAGARGLLREVEVTDDGGLFVERQPPIATLDLHAVFGLSNGALMTVGGNFQQPQGPYEGVALENETP